MANTELQNKQDLPTVCQSLLLVQPTLWFCCQANSKAPKAGQVSYVLLVTITLICCFVCGLIPYEADVTVWKSSTVGVHA